MPSVTLAGKPFNFNIVGSGEPVLHIHGLESKFEGGDYNGPIADRGRETGIPKLGDYLKNNFQLITYNTYTANDTRPCATKADSEEDVSRIADECFVLLQHLNIPQAHVFAHTQVGYVAIKVALEHPDLVKSISLLNFQIIPPLLLRPKVQAAASEMMRKNQLDPRFQQSMEMMRQMMEMAKSGTTPDGEVVDPAIAAQLNSISPAFMEYFAQGADQSDALSVQVRTLAAQMLSTPYDDVPRRIRQPIFAAVWSEAKDRTRQSADLLKAWLSQTEIFTVPKKSHWYSGQNDKDLSEGLADFYSRHAF